MSLSETTNHVCIFLIGGSHFTKQIFTHHHWIKELNNKNYIIKNSRTANLNTLMMECKQFIQYCNNKFENPIIGTIGICSGGYFSLRLKKSLYKLDFCITISPVLNPQYRKARLQDMKETNINPYFNNIIRATPKIRKIYNSIDKNTLIITSKNDVQVPIEMFHDYNIPHFIILQDEGHEITYKPSSKIMNYIYKFIETKTT